MIKNKTVVVVGAGASKDIGLPLGDGLKKSVADILSDEGHKVRRYLYAAATAYMKRDNNRVESAFQAAARYAAPLRHAASIDNFLDQHNDEHDFVAVAKMSIAYVLAEAEKNSRLGGTRTAAEAMDRTSSYFMHDLLNIVVRNHQASNISESLDNLSFIIFNYDRCVERFLDFWLKFRFGIGGQALIDPSMFVHVYGSLGDYFSADTPNPFEYTGEMAFQNPHHDLPRYVDRIRLFTEQEDSTTHSTISYLVGEAETIIFLGFGFEEQNMRFFEERSSGKKIFCTLMGMSDVNRGFICDGLVARFSSIDNWVYPVVGPSGQLFRDCYFPLTSAVGSI